MKLWFNDSSLVLSLTFPTCLQTIRTKYFQFVKSEIAAESFGRKPLASGSEQRNIYRIQCHLHLTLITSNHIPSPTECVKNWHRKAYVLRKFSSGQWQFIFCFLTKRSSVISGYEGNIMIILQTKLLIMEPRIINFAVRVPFCSGAFRYPTIFFSVTTTAIRN